MRIPGENFRIYFEEGVPDGPDDVITVGEAIAIRTKEYIAFYQSLSDRGQARKKTTHDLAITVYIMREVLERVVAYIDADNAQITPALDRN